MKHPRTVFQLVFGCRGHSKKGIWSRGENWAVVGDIGNITGNTKKKGKVGDNKEGILTTPQFEESKATRRLLAEVTRSISSHRGKFSLVVDLNPNRVCQ